MKKDLIFFLTILLISFFINPLQAQDFIKMNTEEIDAYISSRLEPEKKELNEFIESIGGQKEFERLLQIANSLLFARSEQEGDLIANKEDQEKSSFVTIYLMAWNKDAKDKETHLRDSINKIRYVFEKQKREEIKKKQIRQLSSVIKGASAPDKFLLSLDTSREDYINHVNGYNRHIKSNDFSKRQKLDIQVLYTKNKEIVIQQNQSLLQEAYRYNTPHKVFRKECHVKFPRENDAYIYYSLDENGLILYRKKEKDAYLLLFNLSNSAKPVDVIQISNIGLLLKTDINIDENYGNKLPKNLKNNKEIMEVIAWLNTHTLDKKLVIKYKYTHYSRMTVSLAPYAEVYSHPAILGELYENDSLAYRYCSLQLFYAKKKNSSKVETIYILCDKKKQRDYLLIPAKTDLHFEIKQLIPKGYKLDL